MKLNNYEFNKNVVKILTKLNETGKGYIVGGVIRDILLGNTPKDIDFTTNLDFLKTKEIFNNFAPIEVGKAFGVLMIEVENEKFEIARFRSDIDSNGRKPNLIEYVENIEEDLGRRDFTINAMAFNEEGLIDLFGGKKDLENKIIRFIGDANERIKEDGLRILRAFRFMSKLGFKLEEQTEKAIFDNKTMINHISKERIREEFNGILLGSNVVNTLKKMKELGILEMIIPNIDKMYDYNQNNPHHSLDLFEHTLEVVGNVENDLELKYAALLHDIGKPDVMLIDNKTGYSRYFGHEKIGKEMSLEILFDLRQPKKIINNVCDLVEYHMILHNSQSEKTIKKLIHILGEEKTLKLIKLSMADDDNKVDVKDRNNELLENFYKILENDKVPKMNEMKINGYDLLDLNIKKENIKFIKEKLLNEIIEDKLPNEKEILIKRAIEIANQNNYYNVSKSKKIKNKNEIKIR